MKIALPLRRIAALIAAYAIALQGMFAPLVALSAAQAGIPFAFCSGAAPGGMPVGGAPASADHASCVLACCAAIAVATPPAPRVVPYFVAGTAERSSFLHAVPHAVAPRTQFARAPPAA